jgi:Ala-tRNA(Pro) deacylase
MSEDPPVLKQLKEALDAAGISYVHSRHDPVHTSAEAAAARGTPLRSGAKALIVKGVSDEFLMAVMPADLALNGRAFRKLIRSSRLRFATTDELQELTGLEPGMVPPFGSLFGIRTICDEQLARNERINFSAGGHCDSLQMSYDDYIEFERPQLAAITKPSE